MSSLEPADHPGPTYWRSLDELADTPRFRELVEREFPDFAPELLRGPTRRRFLKMMGASLALAGLTACRWPKEVIVPHARRPLDRTPGIPVHYATALERGGVGLPVLVASYDGRPIKVDGNDRHPLMNGASDVYIQASVLDLYDPDRVQTLTRAVRRGGVTQTQTRTWRQFGDYAAQQLAAWRASGGAGLCILSEASSSPTLRRIRDKLMAALPQARWYEYEPLSRDNEREGLRHWAGRPVRPQYDLTQADVILCLDDDLLCRHPAAIKLTRDYAARRTPAATNDYSINRLYAVESTLTVTGSRADQRWAIRSSQIPALLAHLEHALSRQVDGLSASAPDVASPLPADAVQQLADDLAQHRGHAVLTAGPQQPPAVHAHVARLNAALGNVGHTITFTPDLDPERPTHLAAITELTQRMQAGEVQGLVILGGNPVYDAPADLDFAAALAKVPETLHLSLYANETSGQCTWLLPRAHALEAWGDVRAWDGTVSVVQPLIAPLYDGKTPAELLALLLGDSLATGHSLTQATFAAEFAAGGLDAEGAWKQALHDGFVADSAWATEQPTGNALPSLDMTDASEDFEVTFIADYSVYDGRFANNGWLQELPDPLTKVTWDNAALLAPTDAKRLGIQQGDVVKIDAAGRSVEIVAYTLPGQAVGTITLPLGYGRQTGTVATGQGVNTYPLRTTAAAYMLGGAQLSKMGRTYTLATTQDHHAMDTAIGRAETQKRIGVQVREATVGHFREHPDFAEHVVHVPPQKPLFEHHDYSETPYYRWGMAIDLSKCTGCATCVLACQAENNVPVVGKREVERGREMHWIRVDRYFKGDPEHLAGVAHMPVTCQHCETAPCEQVCPVAATLHDEEGLNVMVYNRCIGTRYCSNNCPYKVRRFNWFYNHPAPLHPRGGQGLTDIEKMVFNPEVTVRSRGVMEKCSFCVQRIAQARIKARNAGAQLADGDVVPACAQACPTGAIVFGDLNDPDSAVARLREQPRSYLLLKELNTRPRVNYMARITNPPGDAHGDTHGSHEHGH